MRDPYWTQLVAQATPEERRRAEALADAINHVRRAAAAVAAALTNEPDNERRDPLESVRQTLLDAQVALNELQR